MCDCSFRGSTSLCGSCESLPEHATVSHIPAMRLLHEMTHFGPNSSVTPCNSQEHTHGKGLHLHEPLQVLLPFVCLSLLALLQLHCIIAVHGHALQLPAAALPLHMALSATLLIALAYLTSAPQALSQCHALMLQSVAQHSCICNPGVGSGPPSTKNNHTHHGLLTAATHVAQHLSWMKALSQSQRYSSLNLTGTTATEQHALQ